MKVQLLLVAAMLLGSLMAGCQTNSPEAIQKGPEFSADLRVQAEKGDTLAQYYLGRCFHFRRGVRKNMAKAAKWYRKAAEQNHAQAQSLLGSHYSVGRGVPKDEVEAYKWFLFSKRLRRQR